MATAHRDAPEDQPEPPSLRALREAFGRGLARAGRVYGLNPVLWHLYAAVYLSPGPISLEAAAARAGVARSTASVTLRSLERWSLVTRAPARPGDRRDRYVPRTDALAMVGDWLRTFVAREVEEGQRLLEDIDALRPAAVADLPPAEGALLARRLRAFTRASRLFFGLFTLVTRSGLGDVVARLSPLVRPFIPHDDDDDDDDDTPDRRPPR